jgi:glycosyltransferase involved in cell wall biosynthesis
MLVAGDFTPHGGMDRANLELARFLATDRPVHLVTHRAADEVAKLPNVTVHRVSRPFGRHLLGEPLLARAGRKWAARLAPEGYRVVVNGGNCQWADANWVHYVHAATPPHDVAGSLRRAAARVGRLLYLRAERRALRAARVAVCNSRRTARDVVERLGVSPDRVRVVYLGSDPDQFPHVTPAERSLARAQLGWDDRPWAVFVGALGDTRKGFDTLYAAWRDLCRDPGWDANLAVVGAGAGLTGWRERAVADGLAGRVSFLGFRTDVPRVLAAADLMVHPARYEPYGMGVREALCRGLPAIVSAAAGVSEHYPPALADLILTDPESGAELAARLRHWRANAEQLAARVRPLADELRSHTWADTAREIVAAVEGTPPPPSRSPQQNPRSAVGRPGPAGGTR